ncbi:MAG: MCP four helix bundle domain-containing protein [Desulfobacteraceae bacterium]|nr:MCP four helix bundle domain-containing protein [Desulfobacteraceae bacterium]
MKIRTKIMLGFLILAIMLAVAGAFSIYQLKTIGSSVQSLLDDNYRSINAAKKMTESLEREDSGMLLLLSGKWKEGRRTIRGADENFRQALETAENNLTIDGEKAYVERIRKLYGKYSAFWDRPIAGTADEGNLDWYFGEVQPSFKAVKGAVQELMSVNDKAMYKTASGLKNQAHRAIMPLLVAILSALVFTLLFNFFVNLYIVNPILSITRSIEGFLTHEKPIAVKLDSDDELADLAGSVSNLAAMVKMDRHGSDQ